MESLAGDMYVRKATVEYHASAHYDEQLEVCVRCQRIGSSSILFGCAVFHAERLLITGELVYVFADPTTQTSQPVPQTLRDILEGYEAGRSMVEVRTGGWDELGADARPIRTEVFINEQQIPADMEWDEADKIAIHAVAYNRLGKPLATGRLLDHVPGTAKIGRMAVRDDMRGSAVGRAVLDALMARARVRGDRDVLLHAQASAVGFYRKAGFTPRGPEFEEAGIRHVEMVCAL
jgi:predicted GNAT family N-acyltransferase